MSYIDLSHVFEDRMPGYKMKNEDGSITQFTAKIQPFLTHQQSLPKYQGRASFEISELSLQSSVGTYLDSPYHRYPEGRDISEIRLDDVIMPGVVIDARGRTAFEPVGLEVIPKGLEVSGKAVLFNFGWDRYWGTEQYDSHPFILEEVINYVIDHEAKLVGVDTGNIDNTNDLRRPAHSLLLKNEILIVENLTGLEQLYHKKFIFFAVPWKAKKVASLPIRAFAETF